MTYIEKLKEMAAEVKKRGLYDAVAARVDTITEAAAMLPERNYRELNRAVSEILMLITESGAAK